MLHDLTCPNCGAPGLEAQQPNGVVICKFCGNKFADDDRVACPQCEAINPPDSSFCKQCGGKLKRSCPACGAGNWAGADYCATCGRNLDTLESMSERAAQGHRGALMQQREMANELKAQEAADSQKRMAALWEVEKKRQAILRQQQEEQKRQQSLLLRLALIALGALICVAVVAFIASLMLR